MYESIKSTGRRHPAAAEEWQIEARLTESSGLPNNLISSSTQYLLAASAERRCKPYPSQSTAVSRVVYIMSNQLCHHDVS
jgi:hypothetical protein